MTQLALKNKNLVSVLLVHILILSQMLSLVSLSSGQRKNNELDKDRIIFPNDDNDVTFEDRFGGNQKGEKKDPKARRSIETISAESMADNDDKDVCFHNCEMNEVSLWNSSQTCCLCHLKIIWDLQRMWNNLSSNLNTLYIIICANNNNKQDLHLKITSNSVHKQNSCHLEITFCFCFDKQTCKNARAPSENRKELECVCSAVCSQQIRIWMGDMSHLINIFFLNSIFNEWTFVVVVCFVISENNGSSKAPELGGNNFDCSLVNRRILWPFNAWIFWSRFVAEL